MQMLTSVLSYDDKNSKIYSKYKFVTVTKPILIMTSLFFLENHASM